MLTPVRFFCGIAALWNEPDSHGHQFQPGRTFLRSIAAFSVGSIAIPVYVEHALLPEWPEPIGRVLLLGEGPQGLLVTFLINALTADQDSKLYALLGERWFLSVGMSFSADMRTEVKQPGRSSRYDVTDGLLFEISLSRQPAARSRSYCRAA